jgi:TatD DNase family protein
MQVKLACKLQMPLFIHEREAHNDLMKILMKHVDLPPVVIHCFTGTEEELQTYIDADFYIGITGFVCMGSRGKKLRKFVNKIPLNRLMIETDAPFMKPDGPGKCLPEHLVLVAKELAKLYKISYEELCRITSDNAKRFFRID